MSAPRDISKLMQAFRKFLFAGREFQNCLRFEGHSTARRTQPYPNINGGVNHEIRNNYYYNRDARRSNMPPEVIYTNKTLASPNQGQIKSE